MTLPARADNCGSCLTPDRAVTVYPYFTRPEGEGSVRAHYGCPECGSHWTTSFFLPVTSEQAEANARLLDVETAAWEAAHAEDEEGTAA